jgi:hypothetical protein
MVAAKQSKYDIQWETHAGGAAAIVAKIKTAWPTPLYDFVAQFDPLYYAWLKEGWPEPLSFDEMPNLRDIPEDVFVRNDKGQIINVPISHSGRYWGYRSDKCPFPIKKTRRAPRSAAERARFACPTCCKVKIRWLRCLRSPTAAMRKTWSLAGSSCESWPRLEI